MYTDTPSTGAASVTEHRRRSMSSRGIPSLPPPCRCMPISGLHWATDSDIRTLLLNVYPLEGRRIVGEPVKTRRTGQGLTGQDWWNAFELRWTRPVYSVLASP